MKKLLTVLGLLTLSLSSHAVVMEESGYSVSVGDVIYAQRLIPAQYENEKDRIEELGFAVVQSMYANDTMGIAFLKPTGVTAPDIATTMLYKQDLPYIEVLCKKNTTLKKCLAIEELDSLLDSGIQVFTNGKKIKEVPLTEFVTVP